MYELHTRICPKKEKKNFAYTPPCIGGTHTMCSSTFILQPPVDEITYARAFTILRYPATSTVLQFYIIQNDETLHTIRRKRYNIEVRLHRFYTDRIWGVAVSGTGTKFECSKSSKVFSHY